ncbi:MAG: hypothetical protein CMO97_05145 [Woeseia sp.]|nr:hypothetical protein [Woeseia sp.]|tara:strand:- start:106 stop:348 length:243 start_codon:yes stop_codon:yes gene_type:complete
MEPLIIFSIVLIVYFTNKAALRTARNSHNEEIAREINKKILQNAKLDKLYGRKSGNPAQQINKAMRDVAENKRKNSNFAD